MNNNSANKSPETPAPIGYVWRCDDIHAEQAEPQPQMSPEVAFLEAKAGEMCAQLDAVGYRPDLPIDDPGGLPERVRWACREIKRLRPGEGTQGIPKGAECLVLWEGDKPCPATLPASADETEQTRRCRPEYRWVRMVEVQHGK